MCSHTPEKSMAKTCRLVADPGLGVADMMNAVEQFLEGAESQKKVNLLEFVKTPSGVSWKSSAPGTHLCKLKPLLVAYLAKAKNGVLPSKKHRIALARLDEARDLNQSKNKTRADWCDQVDDQIRMALSHLRNLKVSEISKERLFRKLDISQQETLSQLLDLLSLAPNSVADAESEPAGGEGPGSQLVLASEQKNAAEVPAVPAVPSQLLSAKVDPASIFRQILAKKSDDADDLSSGLASTTRFGGQKCNLVDQDTASKPLLQMLMVDGLVTSEEVGMVREAVLKKPPCKPKAKAKAQTALKKAKAAQQQKPLKKKSSQASLGSGSQHGQDGEPEVKAKGKSRHKKTDEEIAAMPPVQRKKLLCSRAYHRALDSAIKAKKSKEEATTCAREASDKVRQQIDAEIAAAAK